MGRWHPKFQQTIGLFTQRGEEGRWGCTEVSGEGSQVWWGWVSDKVSLSYDQLVSVVTVILMT